MQSVDQVTYLTVERVPLVKDRARMVHFCRLAGYTGEKLTP